MTTNFLRERKSSSDHELFLHHKLGKLHWPLICVVTALSVFGFLMLFSAAQGNMQPWAIKQAARFVIAFPIMLVIAVTDIRIWFRYSYAFYIFGLVFVGMVAVAGFVGMGAQRWINLGPVNIQPSELMKIFLILALARYFHSIHSSDSDNLRQLVLPGLMIFLPFVLILKEPNLGTATVLLLTGIGMFFATGVGWKKFVVAGLGVAAVIPFGWHHLHGYQKRRVITFLNPNEDPLGAGYNIIQSKIAIGSGGFWGKGFLQGSQSQLNFLPEKHTDFIFTMVAEEFGFFGGLAVIFLYALLMFYGIRIALQCKNHYARLIAMGSSVLLFVHVFINMAMVMGMIPVVGVPLPMLSYGGSVIVMTLITYGFVLNAHINREVSLGKTY